MEQQPKKRGPKSINYVKRGNKIKEEVDQLIEAILAEKKNRGENTGSRKIRFTDLDLENEDINTLMEMQLKLSRIIVERNKNNK